MRGARSGATTLEGCGSKVRTVGRKPRSRETRTTSRTKCWCPRWTPSKLPIVTAEGPKPEASATERAIRISVFAPHFDLEAVVSEVHVRWESGFRAFVSKIVANVREIGPPRIQLLHPSEAALNGRVSGMRTMTQGVEKQNIQILKLALRVVGNFAVVGEIRRRSKTKAQDFVFSVQQADGRELHSEEIERLAIDSVQIQTRNRRFRRRVVERVLKYAADNGQRFFLGVDGDGLTLAIVEGTHVVETENMVGMRMGVKDRIDALDAGAEGLGAEIGSRIDQHGVAVVTDQDRG